MGLVRAAVVLCYITIPLSEPSNGLGQKRSLKLIQSSMGRDIFNWIRLLKDLSNLTLNVSRDGASCTSPGNLGWGFTTLIIKNFFVISSLNLSSFSLKPSPLVLSQQALLKTLSPSLL